MPTLVPLFDSIVAEDDDLHLFGLPGSTIEVLFRADDTQADLFADEDGVTPTNNPMTADSEGRFGCWLEAGEYNLIVTTPTSDVSTHPVDVGAGGSVDPGDLVHKSTAETITGKKTFAFDSVSSGVVFQPPTDGYFLDFAYGPTGTVPSQHDRGTPNWWDAVSIGSGASMVYDDDPVPLSPVLNNLKISTTGTAAAKVTMNAAAYRDLTTHYGRFYFYMDTAVAANVVPFVSTVGGQIRVRSSDGKFEILNAGGTAQTLDNADTKSTSVLAAATWYRFEWKIVHSTTVGTITVKLYAGHSTTPVETRVTNGFNTGALPTSIVWGGTTNANLAGGFIRVAALACGCLDYPGPYQGVIANLSVLTADNLNLYKILPGGNQIVRATDNYNLSSGGDPKYMVQRGDPVFWTSPMGIMMGGNYNIGNPLTKTDTDAPDVYADLQSRRFHARSFNLDIINDPPDIMNHRMNLPSAGIDANQPWQPLNPNFLKVGSGASWSTTSDVLTLASDQEPFTERDKGMGIQLGGGSPYKTGASGFQNRNIKEVTGARTCTLTSLPTSASPATTATGVNAINSTSIVAGSTTGFYTPEASTTATGVNATNSATINCGDTTGWASSGWAYLVGVPFWYSGKTGTSFTGCGPHAATTGGEVIAYNLCTAYLGGLAFTYTGVDATHFLGCGNHAATVGGEAIIQGTWRVKAFPYPPYTTGIAAGATVGQTKHGPAAYPYMGRSAAGMNTVSGTKGVGVALTGPTYTWTSADVSRHLLINDNPALSSTGKGSFVVNGVNSTTVNGAQLAGADPFLVASTAGFADSGKVMCGSTAVTYTGRTAVGFTGTTGVPVTAGGEAVSGLLLDSNVGSTLVDVSYRVAGGELDAQADPVQTVMNTAFDLTSHTCNFGSGGTDSIGSDAALQVASGSWTINQILKGVLHVNTTKGGYTQTPLVPVFQVKDDGAFGYGSGFGAARTAVTQITSKSTGVTINGPGGQITTHNAALNAGVSVTFTVTNDRVEATDVVIVNIKSGATADTYHVDVPAVAAGSFKVQLHNFSGSNQSDTIVLSFAVIKGATV